MASYYINRLLQDLENSAIEELKQDPEVWKKFKLLEKVQTALACVNKAMI